jgi:hypothetical protein
LNGAKTYDEFEAYEQLPVSSQRTFPAAPFPRKYVHCVIDDLSYVVEAVHALRAAGYDAGDIHVMASWDFVEALARRQQRQSRLSKALTCLCSFMDEGFGNAYLHEAIRGHHILAVRLSRNEQMEQVRDILALHYARLMKYVDTWTVTDLPPSPKQVEQRISSRGGGL